jgi:hypothetical protein
VDDVLRGEGADPDIMRTKKPSILKAASSALREGIINLHPVALIETNRIVEHRHERIVLQGGNELYSPLVARHLAGADQVVAVICTIGPQLALDGLGNSAVEAVGQQVCMRIGEQAQIIHMTASTPLSPGETEWPVEVGQPQILTLLDPARAGIALTSGGMMIPKKSISFVVGIGPEMTQTDPCDLCSLRERCRYRHA